MVIDIKPVFGKIGGDDNHFIVCVEQGFENNIKPAARPYRHHYVIGFK